MQDIQNRNTTKPVERDASICFCIGSQAHDPLQTTGGLESEYSQIWIKIETKCVKKEQNVILQE